jgi:hypothetical protein
LSVLLWRARGVNQQACVCAGGQIIVLALSDVVTRDEPKERSWLLRARAAHARELGAMVALDQRAQRILVSFAAELEGQAAELERQVQVDSIEKASAANELEARLGAVAAMKPEAPVGSGEDLALLYRERAKRLRTLIEAIQDVQQIQLLRAIADDYEQLANRLLPQ